MNLLQIVDYCKHLESHSIYKTVQIYESWWVVFLPPEKWIITVRVILYQRKDCISYIHMYLYVCGYTDMPFQYCPKLSFIAFEIIFIEMKSKIPEKFLFCLYLSFPPCFPEKLKWKPLCSSCLLKKKKKNVASIMFIEYSPIFLSGETVIIVYWILQK